MEKSQKHHRKSIRLKDYDYSEEGEYFLTIVTQKRLHLFGEIIHDEMRLSLIGKIVLEEWLRIPSIRQEIELGSFSIMPNHFHAIVLINDVDSTNSGEIPEIIINLRRGDRPVAPTNG